MICNSVYTLKKNYNISINGCSKYNINSNTHTQTPAEQITAPFSNKLPSKDIRLYNSNNKNVRLINKLINTNYVSHI